MPISPLLEVVVSSVKSAIAAADGGAQRLELCVNLAEGGTSPPALLIKEVREAVEIMLRVMIRPRSGDFCYTGEELDIMRSEIQQAKVLGANGVVLGVLHRDRKVDVETTRELASLAYPLGVTFHRAFDETPDPMRALKDVIDSGADILLTSGQGTSAMEGKELIRKLVGRAGKRIRILAGAGIDEFNARTLIRETGVREIHVATGVQKNGETDPRLVSRLVYSINNEAERN
jgi:copper homeostasis protein